MIDYLQERFSTAEEAISAAEVQISRERANRKQMADELEQKNEDIKNRITHEK
jgi:hypothetical protein